MAAALGTGTARRRLTAVLGLVILLAISASSCTFEQGRVAALINDSRAAHRLAPLEWNDALGRKAQAWAEHLANRGSLSHSLLADGVPAGWRGIGENVGYGGSIGAVHTAYLNSPGHRANILNARWDAVGTGHVKRGSRVYTVHVFVDWF